ncbi:MAG TPA: IS701 family transposase [Gemmata sp.]
MKTYTPSLEPAVLDRLREYADLFADEFPQSKPAAWAGVYLQGLLLDGERKSIEPLSHRVRLPEGLSSTDPEQALQQFVNQSPWDHDAVLKRYRAHLAHTFASPDGIFLFDDVSFPKQGTHSVGVQRQYCGALGKRANCQVAVSVHYVSPKGHYPLDLRLYLPDSWLTDGTRLDKAGVPKDQRRAWTKPEIALELLDRVRAEGLPGRSVVADAGYGASGPFRAGLEQRGLTYIVGVTGDFVAFTEQPTWDRPEPGRPGSGRPRTRPQLAPSSPRPVALSALAERVRRQRVDWREGTKGMLSGHFAWLRVWPGHGWKTGDCADEQPLWVLIEKQGDDGPLKFAFSNLPAGTSRIRAVRLWKSRWPVEQGYQQLKEELGLDHFEGRSWRGFHHHAAMALLAYGFLLLERHRATEERTQKKAARPERVKKGLPSRCSRYPAFGARCSAC